MAGGSGYRWVVMGLFWAIGLFINWVIISLGVMLPRMSPDLSLTPVLAGWLGSVSWMATTLLNMPFSLWFSRFSAKLIVAIVTAGAAAATVLQGWAPGFQEELVSRILFVLALPALTPATVLLLQQWFRAEEISRANSLAMGIGSAGQTLGISLTPWLMATLGGWRPTFYALGALGLTFALLWPVLARENLSQEYRDSLAAQEGTPLRALAHYPMLWVLAFCQIGGALAYSSFLTFWPTFVTVTHHLSLTTAGLLMSLFPIGSIVGSFSAAAISDRLGLRKPVIWVPGFILPLAYLISINTEAVPIMGAALFVAGFCALVVVPIIFAYPYELAGIKPREVAVAWGLIGTVASAGAAAGPLTVGAIHQATGSLPTALTIAAVCALTLGVLPLFLPETGWRARKNQTA